MVIGTFGQIAYLADWLHPILPAWLIIPVLIVPVALIIFIQPNEVPKLIVKRVHLLAALWYLGITLSIEIYTILGATPHGDLFFRILMHVGWLQFASLFKR